MQNDVARVTAMANAIGGSDVMCRYEWSGRRFVWNFYRHQKRIAQVVHIDSVVPKMERLVEEIEEENNKETS